MCLVREDSMRTYKNVMLNGKHEKNNWIQFIFEDS